MRKFKFTVLSEEGTLFEDLVSKIVISTDKGEITVLKNHIPLITTISKGRLIIDNKDRYQIKEGILKIKQDETILMVSEVQKNKIKE